MRVIGAEELRQAAELTHLIDALEAGHAKPKPETADSLVGPADARYFVRSGHDGGELVGSKLITIFPDNPSEGDLPAVQALIVLFDGNNGSPLAALDATELTYWKTAADSALGSKLLSRRNAATLAIAGAGGLAPWLVRGHMAVRPGIERVLVWNRTVEKAAALAKQLQSEGIPAEQVDAFEDAVRGADIVSTVTMAPEPILRGVWLNPGAHVDLVGGFSADTREADDDVMKRGRLFVNCRESALDGVGDIDGPMRSGVIGEGDILGDLFDLIGGKTAGRKSAKDITVYKNAGGAHIDLMVARALLERIGEGVK